jgi:hypothetical protein
MSNIKTNAHHKVSKKQLIVFLLYYNITNTMEHIGLLEELVVMTRGENIPWILWNPNVHYHFHSKPRFSPIECRDKLATVASLQISFSSSFISCLSILRFIV